jgi:hypothetical protein
MKGTRSLVIGLALASVAQAHAIYFNDFESGNFVGWTIDGNPVTSTTISPNAASTRFLGEYDNQTLKLNLSSLPSHSSVRVSFDLYILKSWDGSGSPGPDIFRFSIDGNLMFNETFSNASGLQSHGPAPLNLPRTWADASNTLGYTFFGDTVYRFGNSPNNAAFEILHSGSSLELTWQALNLQGISDESWGIDNVLVELRGGGGGGGGPVIPGPAAVLPFLASMIALRRRTRK